MNEIWKDIKGYEGLYQVSNLGNIKRILFVNNKVTKPKERTIKQTLDGKGNYKTVGLCKNGILKRFNIHRLVAETFIQDKSTFKSAPKEDRDLIILDDLKVNHKDENKQNNNVENLEWCTVLYNNLYNGRASNVGKQNRIKVMQYDKNGDFIKEWEYIGKIEKELGLSHSSISACCKGKQKTCGGYKWEYKIKQS